MVTLCSFFLRGYSLPDFDSDGPAYNSLAFEGYGIQAYFMAPMRMREILVGKNLFVTELIVMELAISLAVLIWQLGFPGLPYFLSSIIASAFAVAGQLTIANWSAPSFPKKMEIGKLKGQRNSGFAAWMAFGAQNRDRPNRHHGFSGRSLFFTKVSRAGQF